MLRSPRTLEALALRQVIKERGMRNLPSGLVPRMRQELEELARIPGEYEIVDRQTTTYKEDREVENQAYKIDLKIGQRIKVSCPTGSTWRVEMTGYDREFSLNQETFSTYSKDGFVEDGVLKCEKWMKVDEVGGQKAFVNNTLESFHLDPRSCLIWTYRIYSKIRNETLVLTASTKRI